MIIDIKDLPREQLHRMLWRWLSDNPGAEKHEWPYWYLFSTIDEESYNQFCFACGEDNYVTSCNNNNNDNDNDDDDQSVSCLECPIDWQLYGWCYDPESEFREWQYAIKCKNISEIRHWADIIARLPWRDRK